MNRARPGLVAAVLFAIHSALLGSFVVVDRLVEPEEFAYGDYSIHLLDGLQVAHFLETRGSFWGYSPWYFAGYPAGVFDAPSNRATGVLFALLPSLDPAVLFKIYVTVLLLAAPVMVALACRLDGSAGWSGVVGLLLAVTYFQQDGIVFVFCRYGMFHFLAASHLAVLCVAQHQMLLRRPSVTAVLLGAGLTWLCLLWHPATPVLLAPGLLASHLRPGVTGRGRSMAAIALAAAAVLSLPWVWALLRNVAFVGPDSGFWSTVDVSLGRDLFLADDHIVRNLLFLLLAIDIGRGRGRVTPYAASALAFLALRYLGSEIPIVDRLEPARFTIPAGLFAIPGAGRTLRELVVGIRAGRWRLRSGRTILAGSMAFGLVASPIAVDPNWSWVPNLLLWSQPLGEKAEGLELVQALERHTDRSARLWIEQDWAGSRLHGFVSAYVRTRLDREQLGGPHPFVKVIHNHLSFFDGYLAGRRVMDMTAAEVAAECARYNVRWVVARLPRTISAIERLADDGSLLVRVADGRGFAIYEVATPSSWFLIGEGRVSADYDRLRVSDATPGEVVLRYHYHPGLVARPHLQLSAYPVPGDEVGFIRVLNGEVRDFELVVGF